MLMVKSDKKSKVFREQIYLLKEYSRLHDLPEVRHQRPVPRLPSACTIQPHSRMLKRSNAQEVEHGVTFLSLCLQLIPPHLSLILSHIPFNPPRHWLLPLQDLEQDMRQHLDLHFTSDSSNVDKVLSIYPSALSTRVLRWERGNALE